MTRGKSKRPGTRAGGGGTNITKKPRPQLPDDLPDAAEAALDDLLSSSHLRVDDDDELKTQARSTSEVALEELIPIDTDEDNEDDEPFTRARSRRLPSRVAPLPSARPATARPATARPVSSSSSGAPPMERTVHGLRNAEGGPPMERTIHCTDHRAEPETSARPGRPVPSSRADMPLRAMEAELDDVVDSLAQDVAGSLARDGVNELDDDGIGALDEGVELTTNRAPDEVASRASGQLTTSLAPGSRASGQLTTSLHPDEPMTTNLPSQAPSSRGAPDRTEPVDRFDEVDDDEDLDDIGMGELPARKRSNRSGPHVLPRDESSGRTGQGGPRGPDPRSQPSAPHTMPRAPEQRSQQSAPHTMPRAPEQRSQQSAPHTMPRAPEQRSQQSAPHTMPRGPDQRSQQSAPHTMPRNPAPERLDEPATSSAHVQRASLVGRNDPGGTDEPVTRFARDRADEPATRAARDRAGEPATRSARDHFDEPPTRVPGAPRDEPRTTARQPEPRTSSGDARAQAGLLEPRTSSGEARAQTGLPQPRGGDPSTRAPLPEPRSQHGAPHVTPRFAAPDVLDEAATRAAPSKRGEPAPAARQPLHRNTAPILDEHAFDEGSLGDGSIDSAINSGIDDSSLDDMDLGDHAPRDLSALTFAIYEESAHLAAAQTAITEAGHTVVVAAAGRDGVGRVVNAIHNGGVDVVLVTARGGDVVIDAALSVEPRRPVIIAVGDGSTVEAVGLAASANADLATVRPHSAERIAPLAFAAARIDAERRIAASAKGAEQVLRQRLEDMADAEPGGLLPFEMFQRVLELEIKRAKRFEYPLSVALFAVEITPPPPPAGIRGILRARAGNALINTVRDIDIATQLDHERFLVLLPYTDLKGAASVGKRVIAAVSAGDPVISSGRSFPPRVVGAVAGMKKGEPVSFAKLMKNATRALEQARKDGADLAVQP